jgi:hypothetical protein
VHERVDPARAGRPEELDLVGRKLVRSEDAGANRVVDVVVYVRDTVDEADDLPLERFGLGGPGVVQDPVPHLGCEV